MLDERRTLGVPTPLVDLTVDPIPGRFEASPVGRQPTGGGHPQRALDRNPALQSRVGELLASAAGLPDPLVRLIPVLADPVDDVGEVVPRRASSRKPLIPGPSSASSRLAPSRTSKES